MTLQGGAVSLLKPWLKNKRMMSTKAPATYFKVHIKDSALNCGVLCEAAADIDP